MGQLHNRIPLGRKKEETFALCDSMDGPGERCAKWSKSEKGKYYMISCIYRI